jgi:peptidoglycan/LPS O-acetylase OafA/YrhL
MLNYEERIAEHKIELGEFFILRFSRLYPLCWLTSLIMLIGYCISVFLGGKLQFSYWSLVKSFLVVGVYVIDAGGPILNGVEWTLSLEIAAYFLFFLISWFAKKKNGILLFFVPIILGAMIENMNIMNIPILNINFATILPSFFMGCLTCKLYLCCNNKRYKNKITLCCSFIILFTFVSWFKPGIHFIGDSFSSQVLNYSIVVFPSFIIMVLFLPFLKKFFSISPFRYLGNLSFSIYLIHYPVLFIISELHAHGIILFNASSKKNLLLVIIIVLILSHISYYFFERPMQKWIRDKYYKWKAGQSTVSPACDSV